MKNESLNKFWLGGNIFGYSAQEDDVIDILSSAEKVGIFGVDTSSSYTDGLSETIIGFWLNHDNVRRERLFISTKVGLKSYQSPIGLGHPDKIVETLELSLQRLQTEYVDVLFLHAPDPATNIFLTVSAFYNLMEQNLIKGFGICNASISDTQNYLSAIHSYGGSSKDLYIQNYFNWARRKPEYWNDFWESGHRNHFNSVSYGLLARGVFIPKFETGDRNSRKNLNLNIKAEIKSPKLMSKFEIVEGICRSKGQTLYSYALTYGYYLSRYSIVGIRTLDQLGKLIEFSENLMCEKDFNEIRKEIQDLNLEFLESLGDPQTIL
jgi:aryl-alcohol dehydrogenase-like predicted oxidoreductase